MCLVKKANASQTEKCNWWTGPTPDLWPPRDHRQSWSSEYTVSEPELHQVVSGYICFPANPLRPFSPTVPYTSPFNSEDPNGASLYNIHSGSSWLHAALPLLLDHACTLQITQSKKQENESRLLYSLIWKEMIGRKAGFKILTKSWRKVNGERVQGVGTKYIRIAKVYREDSAIGLRTGALEK